MVVCGTWVVIIEKHIPSHINAHSIVSPRIVAKALFLRAFIPLYRVSLKPSGP